MRPALAIDRSKGGGLRASVGEFEPPCLGDDGVLGTAKNISDLTRRNLGARPQLTKGGDIVVAPQNFIHTNHKTPVDTIYIAAIYSNTESERQCRN
jgi:hypothetical protein